MDGRESRGRVGTEENRRHQKLRHRKVRVVRDYGCFDRREAPQFYEDVIKGRETKHPEPAR